MEIERKWLVAGWPDASLNLTLVEEHHMEQGYISTQPTVRLRKEISRGGKTEYILCFKSGRGLSREEIEMPLSEEMFDDLAQKILAKPMIPKLRRSYALPSGLVLEVNEVDQGQPTAFYYAEIEFETEAAALEWNAAQVGGVLQREGNVIPEFDLSAYLTREVTYEKGQSMAEYWAATRG